LNRKNNIVSAALALVATLALVAFSVCAAPVKKRSRGRVRPTVPLRDEVRRNLPYQIVVGEAPADKSIVTAAVGAMTTLYLPEPFLGLRSAHRDKLGIIESDEKTAQHAVYLFPVTGVPSTNVVIEMPSGSASFFLRVMDFGASPQPGQFNGEVIVKPAFYAEEMARLNRTVSDYDLRVQRAERRVREAEVKTMEAVAAAEKSWGAGVLAGRYESLVVLEQTQGGAKKRKTFSAGNVRVTQASPLVPGTEGWFGVFKIENRGTLTKRLDGMETEAGRVLYARAGTRELLGKTTALIAVYIERPTPPAAITFNVAGMPLRVQVQ